MGIVEFLEARIAEDEADAQAADEGRLLTWSKNDHMVIVDSGFIQTFTPSRVLREVAAKRAVVVEHKLVPAKNVWGKSTGGFGCELCDSTPDLDLGGIEIERSGGCKTLRTLAVIFSDHPDFDEEWRP